jgi:putative transposase
LINKYEILIPDAYYHIYNRANGNERMFMTTNNYDYFLNKYQQYISPVVDTFCYCLMPNHFHFLIRIKSEQTLKKFFAAQQKDLQDIENLEGLIAQQFSNFFNAYAKAFNKMYSRKGSLFMHTYKRKRVQDEIYLKQLVRYIHLNPIEANISQTIYSWPFSSYLAIIDRDTQFINSNEVISWFYDIENFKSFHLTS